MAAGTRGAAGGAGIAGRLGRSPRRSVPGFMCKCIGVRAGRAGCGGLHRSSVRGVTRYVPLCWQFKVRDSVSVIPFGVSVVFPWLGRCTRSIGSGWQSVQAVPGLCWVICLLYLSVISVSDNTRSCGCHFGEKHSLPRHYGENAASVGRRVGD